MPHRHESCVDRNRAAPNLGQDCLRYSATTGLVSEPSPSIVTVTVSPGLSQRLGVRPRPTPGGVPVDTISPGSNGVMDDKCSINAGMPKTSSLVFEFCRTSL